MNYSENAARSMYGQTPRGPENGSDTPWLVQEQSGAMNVTYTPGATERMMTVAEVSEQVERLGYWPIDTKDKEGRDREGPDIAGDAIGKAYSSQRPARFEIGGRTYSVEPAYLTQRLDLEGEMQPGDGQYTPDPGDRLSYALAAAVAQALREGHPVGMRFGSMTLRVDPERVRELFADDSSQQDKNAPADERPPLEYEVLGGNTLRGAEKGARNLANVRGRRVTFTFNGREYTVDPS